MAEKVHFQYTIERRADGTAVLLLSGDIDENVQLVTLAGDLDGKVEIDAYEVRRINSVGVGEWIKFMRALDDVGEVTLVRCSRAIVTQLNTIANFKGKARVASVAAPFYCESCDEEARHVIELPERGASVSPSEILGGPHLCAACQKSLEFDDFPERYFMFLAAEN